MIKDICLSRWDVKEVVSITNLYEYWNVMRLEQGNMDVILSCDETKNVWTFSMIYGGT